MFPLPGSPRGARYLRMAVAFFICATCAALGWHFIHIAYTALALLPPPLLGLPPPVLFQALLSGVPGVYLWSVSMAFLIFTAIKIDIPGKERHLSKFTFAMHVGRGFLWLTVPIALLWVAGNLYVSY